MPAETGDPKRRYKPMGERAATVPRQYRAGLMKDGDGRAAPIRDIRQRYGALVNHCGGLEEMSAVELQRAERLAHVEHWLGRMESFLREKGAPMLPEQIANQYFALLHASIRLGDGLGTKRRAKRAESLQEYIARSSTDTGDAS